MAFSYSKHLFIRTIGNRSGTKQLLPLLETKTSFSLSAVNYSDPDKAPSQGINRAMQAYLKRAAEHDKFLQQEQEEFEKGKKHLANMMGLNAENLTQKQIDESIEYLFPSGLFVPGARPMMKPPAELFSKRKEAQFHATGRPYHFLFYTAKPNFVELLHTAAKKLEEVNAFEDKMRSIGAMDPDRKLNLTGSEWLSKQTLEKKIIEKVLDFEYEKYIEVFERLASHPYGYVVEDFIRAYRTNLAKVEDKKTLTPECAEDGSLVVKIERVTRKTCHASVKVTYPGSGVFKINNKGLNYFLQIPPREQVVFPLIFTEMEGKVDVEATVEGPGEMSQAGALRLGIAKALQAFVSAEMQLKMKLAGLLQRDVRRRERKKPGKDGARRRYTWLKR